MFYLFRLLSIFPLLSIYNMSSNKIKLHNFFKIFRNKTKDKAIYEYNLGLKIYNFFIIFKNKMHIYEYYFCCKID